MTDHEMTRLCAEAMGYEIDDGPSNGGGVGNTGFDMLGRAVLDWHNGKFFAPLQDDADAMALVKKYATEIWKGRSEWRVAIDERFLTVSADLNRAICGCVAKMQAAKATV